MTAARRTDIGTGDLNRGAPTEVLVSATTRMVDELRRDSATQDLGPAALARGLMVVGDGAMTPSLMAQIAASLRIQVRSAQAPWTAALNGAGLAAMSVARHPATRLIGRAVACLPIAVWCHINVRTAAAVHSSGPDPDRAPRGRRSHRRRRRRHAATPGSPRTPAQ